MDASNNHQPPTTHRVGGCYGERYSLKALRLLKAIEGFACLANWGEKRAKSTNRLQLINFVFCHKTKLMHRGMRVLRGML